MPSIPLECSGDWSEVSPRSDAPDLLVESAGRLLHLGSDGTELFDFGAVGPVECPIAYDARRRVAYRFVCGANPFAKDFSLICAYDLVGHKRRLVSELPLNQWVLWAFEWIDGPDGKGGQLLGLLASDLPTEGQVCIQHRLFALDPAQPVVRARALCRDAYRPLAFSKRRREFIFSGAEGTYLVGLNGGRVHSLSNDRLSPADGAGFDPVVAGRVALSGEGIHLWDTELGALSRLTKIGRYPVWSADGSRLWYAGSSSSLMCYDVGNDSVTPVLAIRQDRSPDFWRSRAPQISPCGRYLAVMLSAKKLKGVTRKAGGIQKTEKVFEDQNCFVVLDLSSSEFWRTEGAYFSAFRWV